MRPLKKVLITFVDDFLIASYLAKELEKLSIEVDIYITNYSGHWLHKYLFKRANKLARSLRLVPAHTDLFWWSRFSYKRFQDQEFKNRIDAFKPDLILCIHGQRFGEAPLRNTNIPKFGWWVEPNPDRETLVRFASLFDLYLSYDSELVDVLNSCNIHSQYQSHVASPSDFYPIQKKTKQLDVLMYGGWSPWREEVLFSAYQATKNIALYGNGWPKKCTLFSKADLFKIYRGKEVIGADLNQEINNSTIVVNAQRLKGFSTGLDTRVFDVLASGALLLTDAPKDLFRHFEDQQDLLVYERSSEVPGLIKAILSGKFDAERIKRRGREKVLERLTYQVLSQKILDEFAKRWQ